MMREGKRKEEGIHRVPLPQAVNRPASTPLGYISLPSTASQWRTGRRRRGVGSGSPRRTHPLGPIAHRDGRVLVQHHVRHDRRARDRARSVRQNAWRCCLLPSTPRLREVRGERGRRYSCRLVPIPIVISPRRGRRSEARVVVITGPSAGPANGERVVAPRPTGEHAAPPDVWRRQWLLATGLGRESIFHVGICRGLRERRGEGEVYWGRVERGQLRNRGAFAFVEPCHVVYWRGPERRVCAQVGHA